jgi:hypothetical protein
MNRAKVFHDILSEQYLLCQCPRARSIYCLVDLELRQGSDIVSCCELLLRNSIFLRTQMKISYLCLMVLGWDCSEEGIVNKGG